MRNLFTGKRKRILSVVMTAALLFSSPGDIMVSHGEEAAGKTLPTHEAADTAIWTGSICLNKQEMTAKGETTSENLTEFCGKDNWGIWSGGGSEDGWIAANMMMRMDTFSEGCWINVVGPTSEEIAYLTEELHLDRSFVSAALDEEESSRVEVEDDQTLIIIDTPLAVTEAENTLVYTTMPLGIIVTKSNVVTVCLNEITAVNDIASGVVRNVQTAMKTRFLLTLLLRVAQSFLIRLKHINKLTSQMETELHHSMQNKQLVQMMGLQKSLVYFSTSLKANEITLEKIYRGRVIKLYEEDQDLLEDVLIEFKQAVEMSGTYSSILQETMDAFSSIISNNMNQVMKTLTIVTVLMEIPTMIFSFYGMNMQDLNRFIPFTGFALSLSIGIVGLVAFIFWRKKY